MRFAPSILSFDLSRMAESLPRLAAAGPEAIHLDVMDGSFVPPITFGDVFVASLRPLVSLLFEVHLMAVNPENHFEGFIKAGCGRVIFHAEATAHTHRLVHQLKSMGVEAGVAINPGTPVDAILPVIDDIDLALVMTVDPGWGGQAFLDSTLKKIQAVRAARPDLTIEVDGGIVPDTIGKAMAAGANLFVVGSYLAKAESLSEAVAKLEQACC
jgi:ribulose-phosphate 3-epimerase